MEVLCALTISTYHSLWLTMQLALTEALLTLCPMPHTNDPAKIHKAVPTCQFWQDLPYAKQQMETFLLLMKVCNGNALCTYDLHVLFVTADDAPRSNRSLIDALPYAPYKCSCPGHCAQTHPITMCPHSIPCFISQGLELSDCPRTQYHRLPQRSFYGT